MATAAIENYPVSADDWPDDNEEGHRGAPAMAVRGAWQGLYGEPIHESLTLSALMRVSGSGVSPGTRINTANNADWEFVRGAVWNDDPAGLLFEDKSGTNQVYATGAEWGTQYTFGKSEWEPGLYGGNRYYNVIGRSHYGDMQFLHCMACAEGEQPLETKRKVMIWMEVMYKLASGEDPNITPDTLLAHTKLGDLLATPDDYLGGSLPPPYQPLRYMLAPKSVFSALDIRRRALGSMFHVIQDSYAIGHTKRVPMNPGDVASESPLVYKPGTTDRWGAILNFHTYYGQDDGQHKHFDHGSDKIPDPGNLGNLDQWNGLLGCRDAADKCTELAQLRFTGKTWGGTGGVEEFLDQHVFVVDKNATPANHSI
ncbi:hypothetical protein Micbo1qcDRAFT_223267 [Microdochium bolleyi]|uniref:Uncharacterized protein n=1 Tax=Microdochium bolleyi TaxID=196109 RepID=A0A136IK64_9PEZI|nr:hypothetical protein Micbo1qcDRAFT_223267 [Microdochium bolleyi]